ncbi:hypothetical protein PWY87_26915 [Kribbella solani]|uniref:hypothetical protein n=1 Tax=Kribbella solani TaxID=236067 RepID=UPI0029A4F537|nr:hypothetical protein [Kribbella solani]MDX3005337.1 hypothetical protein [Kribbella solani]
MKNTRRRAHLSAALGVAVTIAAAVGFPSQAHAAAPPFTGCSVIDDYIQAESDQSGRWVSAFIKYKCNTGKEYSFAGRLQRVTSTGPERVIDGGHAGVDTAPYLLFGSNYCSSTAMTTYYVTYQLQIAGVDKLYTTPRRTLPCYALK